MLTGVFTNSSSIPIDYNLYRKIWSLQDYFRKPGQCYDKSAWKCFTSVSLSYFNSEFLNVKQIGLCVFLENRHKIIYADCLTGTLFVCVCVCV